MNGSIWKFLSSLEEEELFIEQACDHIYTHLKKYNPLFPLVSTFLVFPQYTCEGVL